MKLLLIFFGIILAVTTFSEAIRDQETRLYGRASVARPGSGPLKLAPVKDSSSQPGKENPQKLTLTRFSPKSHPRHLVGQLVGQHKKDIVNDITRDSQMIVQLTHEAQTKALLKRKVECYRRMETEEHSIAGLFCNRTWDNIMCWQDTPAGSTVEQSCPSYINGFDTDENASRICLPNGTWFVPSYLNGTMSGWTDFMSCLAPTNVSSGREQDNNIDLGVANMVKKHMNEFRLMYNIGYALSLVCLLLAVAIMLYFRRLHCPRNAIHLNLFLAFILRALMNTIKENLFVQSLGFPGDVGNWDNNTIYFKEGAHWECRLFYSLFQYVLMASYIWIFVEGLYLHMLIFVSVFTEKTRILWYMVFGWSMPVPFVLAWAISRYLIDNTLCWNTSTNSSGLTWIMKGPVMLSIVLNFIFFISIVRVLFTKLTSSHCPESKRQRYRRLARSTLVLIPIFGVYYIVFTFPLDNLDDTTSFVMLFIEMFFNSYQGVIIAIVLCFVNAEVRGEIRKAWTRHNYRRNSAISMNQSQCRVRKQSKDIPVSENYNMGNCYGRKKGCLRNNTSITNFEESLPLTAFAKPNEVNQNDGVFDTENNSLLHQKELNSDNETDTKDDSDVKVKINILNIQRKSKDDIDRNLSSVHIETLQNGTTINETKHINNNTEKSETDADADQRRVTLEHENLIHVA